MPLPVILWGAAAALGLWAVHEFFSEDEKEKIEDKRIVILGDRAVGKTHLYDFPYNLFLSVLVEGNAHTKQTAPEIAHDIVHVKHPLSTRHHALGKLTHHTRAQ